MDPDPLLAKDWAGLRFRTPFLVASGPASKSVDQLVRAERAGWGGACTKLCVAPRPSISHPPRYRWLPAAGYHVFTAESRLDLDEGLRLVDAGRRKTRDLVLLANIAYAGDGGSAGWADLAKRFEDAGAHALELNLCCPNMSFNLDEIGEREPARPASGASLGSRPEVVAAIVRAVKGRVRLPVVAKLTPEGGRIGEVARAAVEAGADAVSGTANRLGIPPIDIYRPETLAWRLQRGNSLGCLSGPWLKPLALRDVFQMRTAIGPAPVLLGTGGIRDFRDAVEMCLVGADFFGVCTEVMLRGYALLARILRDLRAYLKETGRGSLSQARDAALPHFRSSARIETLPGHARVDAAACTGCGTCARIAHCGAIRIAKRKASIDREACRGCSTCVDVCPEGALAMVES